MLVITPTPVGNLEDITLRSLRMLSEAHTILCEDSRVTRKLIELLKIEQKPQYIQLVKNHEINYTGIEKALKLSLDWTVCVCTDAGTPGISDPGREVVKMAQDLQIPYTVLPGATSIIPAVVSSGFVKKEFLFLGFLPIKKGRKTAWESINKAKQPVCLLESVHRIQKWIEEAKIYLHPTQKICICREISKQFETIWLGKTSDLDEIKLVEKGEFVIIIDVLE